MADVVILSCGHVPANRKPDVEIAADQCSDCNTIARFNLTGPMREKLRLKAYDRTEKAMEPYFARR